MKYSEVAKIKETIMTTLEKVVDEMLNQIQSNELAQVLEEDKRVNDIRIKGEQVYHQNIDLQPGYFDASLVIDFPECKGSNGKGFVIFCNPTVPLHDPYLNEKCHNYSHAIMSDKLRQIKESKDK